MVARRTSSGNSHPHRSIGSRAAELDRYPSNTALYADRDLVEGIDYVRRFSVSTANTTILAPHGGDIEAGTSELCLAIAGYHPATLRLTFPTYDYWIFEGVRSDGNASLHVASVRCDDVIANISCRECAHALSLHGCLPSSAQVPEGARAVLIGGRDAVFRHWLRAEYLAAGFHAIDASEHGFLSGSSLDNIVNRTSQRMGAQLETTTALRHAMFGIDTLRERPRTTTPVFWEFVQATRAAIRHAETDERAERHPAT